MSDIYIILGAGESNRTALTRFLAHNGLTTEAYPAVVYGVQEELNEDPEAARMLEADATCAVHGLPRGWAATEDPLPLPPDEGTLFFLTDGRANPVDELEALKAWITTHGLNLARIFTVVDCALLEKESGAGAWYDACIHFSDVVLLANRTDVSKKWVHDYEKQLRRQALPCHISYVKKGGTVDTPLELLFPEARRISLFFDADDASPEPILEVEIEGDADEDDVDPRDPQSDPYLKRTDAGYRAKRLVDITRFLPH